MRFKLVLGCSVLLAYGNGLANAGEKWTSDQIIEKAVKAAGGKKAILKQKTSKMREKGTYYGMGDGLPYTANYATQMPDKFRMEVEGFFVKILNGDKGWMSFMGQTKPMPKKQVEVEQSDMHAGVVATLIPFVAKKGYKFKALGAKKDMVGLVVSKKGTNDVKLYFNNKSFLLAKAIYKTKDPDKEFKEVTQEVTYSDYKKTNGISVPMKLKITRDGIRFVEAEILEFNFGAKIDAKTFAQP